MTHSSAVSAVSRLSALSSLGVLLGILALLGGCGGSAGPRRAAVNEPVGAGEAWTRTQTEPITTNTLAPGRGVRSDADADNPNDTDGNGDLDTAIVGGPDPDSDNPVPAGLRFPDSDDRDVFAYGHRGATETRRTIAGVVRRYFTAAGSGDGESGCALLLPSLASSLPNGYTGSSAPRYMRGVAHSCAAVLAMLYRHYRRELAASTRIFAVRVGHDRAQVVVASRTLRASSIFLLRKGGKWWLIEVFGKPLP